MLAIVLAGIGLGGLAAGMMHHRSARPNQLLPILLLLTAFAVLLSYLFFPGEAVKTPGGAFSLASWPQIALLCLALMFPVSFLSGILFPTIVALVHASVEDRMNSTGITTLFNTAGAAVGPLIARFTLLPNLGLQWSLVLCAVAYALLAALGGEQTALSFKRPIKFVIAALYAAVLVIVAIIQYHREIGRASCRERV